MRLVIADDHRLLLDALTTALRGHGCEVVEAVTSPAHALAAVMRHHPDICLLDVRFPDGSGLAAAREIVDLAPSTRVVLFTGQDDPAAVLEGVDIGAVGYLRKDQGIDGVVATLRRVMAGETVVDGTLLRAAIREEAARTRRRRETPLSHLTARERQVLRLLGEGLGTPEIATTMHISRSTARTHVQNVLSKLGVHSRLQAVAVLRRDGERIG